MKMKFYTWKDVDRQFLLKRTVWENTIISIDVYPTDITVYVKPDTQDKVIEILQSLFGSNYDPMTNKINLDIGNQELPVAIQEDDGISSNKKILPLFANVLYQPSSYPVQAPEDLVVPSSHSIPIRAVLGGHCRCWPFPKHGQPSWRTRTPIVC